MEKSTVSTFTPTSEYTFLLSELGNSGCPLDKLYAATLYCYSPTGMANKGRLPPRPKIVQDFISAYVKNPNSKKSKTLSQQVRMHMVDDFRLRQEIEKGRAFLKYAKNRARELSQESEQAIKKAWEILCEAVSDSQRTEQAIEKAQKDLYEAARNF